MALIESSTTKTPQIRAYLQIDHKEIDKDANMTQKLRNNFEDSKSQSFPKWRQLKISKDPLKVLWLRAHLALMLV